MDVRDVQSAHLGELWYRSNIVFRVTDTLDIDRFRLFVNGRFKILGVISVDKLDADPIFLERHCKLSVSNTPCTVDGRLRTFELVVCLTRTDQDNFTLNQNEIWCVPRRKGMSWLAETLIVTWTIKDVRKHLRRHDVIA